MLIRPSEYLNFLINDNTTGVLIPDHLGGFNSAYRSTVLDRLAEQADARSMTVTTEYIVDQKIQDRYPTFDFRFDFNTHQKVLNHFGEYNIHPEKSFDNLLCSFNGSPHVGRQLLTSALHRFGLFNPKYCSKNFPITNEQVSGHIAQYVGEDNQ